MTIAQIWQGMQAAMSGETIERLGRESKMIKRQNKITAAAFCQGLVYGYIANSEASESEQAQSVSRAGRAVTAQAVQARMTAESAEFLKQVLESLITKVVIPDKIGRSILDRFTEVNVQDSTTVTLPDELRHIWASCSGRACHSNAAIKIQVDWDLRNGVFKNITLHDGKEQDRKAPAQNAQVVPGSLRVADLGYFSLPVLKATAEAGGYWLTRLLPQVGLQDENGEHFDVESWLKTGCKTEQDQVECMVLVGKKEQLKARLVAVRVSAKTATAQRRKINRQAKKKGMTPNRLTLALANWHVYLTNVAHDLLNIEDVLHIGRARWQIELLFKLWKSIGRIDESRAKRPYRVLCELYAKMIGQIIQHWLIMHISWQNLDRSMFKVAAVIKNAAVALQIAMQSSLHAFERVIDSISIGIESTCRINKRGKHRSNAQLLALS